MKPATDFGHFLYNKCPVTWWRCQARVRQSGWPRVSSRGSSLRRGVAGRVWPGGRYAWSGCGKQDSQTFSPPCECVGGATARQSGRISARSFPTCIWRASHLWKTDREPFGNCIFWTYCMMPTGVWKTRQYWGQKEGWGREGPILPPVTQY